MSNATFDRPDTADAQDQRQNLSNLSSEEEFEALLTREQPRHAAVWKRSQLDRRSFMKVMGATLALTGLAGCTPKPPDQPIVPYVRTPEFVIPGNPIFFATTMPMGGYGMGAVIETHEGRPTRIEGNPFHPASLGSSDRFLLASILDLYHPDRLTDVRNADTACKAGTLSTVRSDGAGGCPNGQGLYLLTEAVKPPTMKAQIDALLAAYPGAQWHQYEPVNEGQRFPRRATGVRRAGEHGLPLRPGRRSAGAGWGFPHPCPAASATPATSWTVAACAWRQTAHHR
ncbi:MAG: TAT-variant-translocated molybdopterin oxidoreductase [Caldilineaceae bacterium]